MNVYALVHLDLATGRRKDLPWRFERQEEALAKVAALTMVDPDQTYVVKMMPLPQAKSRQGQPQR